MNNRTHRSLYLLAFTGTLLATISTSNAAPLLEIVKSGTTTTATDSIVAGTSQYLIDLKLDTSGDPVSGLMLYLTSSSPSIVFGLTPVVALNDPFVAADIFAAPIAGAALNQASGTTVLFKGTAGDYPAFSSKAILTYALNTSSLVPGDYLLTPVGEELTFTGTTRTNFAAPGAFSLNVQPVPEPSSMLWGALIAGSLGLVRSRRGRASAVEQRR